MDEPEIAYEFVKNLLLEESLYKKTEITPNNIDVYYYLANNEVIKQFDCYCIHCKNDSVFKIVENLKNGVVRVSNFDLQLDYLYGRHVLNFECQRCSKRDYSFTIFIDDKTAQKIGQYPSLADLQLHDIEKYKKVLAKDYKEFSKAIGLYANGIGIGSFVYLRRIFENLIIDTYKKNQLEIDGFNNKVMKEKVKSLKGYLPEIIHEIPQLYGVISKGIHELSEEECKEIFPQLKLAIELILDKKITMLSEKNKLEKLKRSISDVASRFS